MLVKIMDDYRKTKMYEKFKKDQLLAICKKHKLKGYYKLEKNYLIQLMIKEDIPPILPEDYKKKEINWDILEIYENTEPEDYNKFNIQELKEIIKRKGYIGGLTKLKKEEIIDILVNDKIDKKSLLNTYNIAMMLYNRKKLKNKYNDRYFDISYIKRKIEEKLEYFNEIDDIIESLLTNIENYFFSNDYESENELDNESENELDNESDNEEEYRFEKEDELMERYFDYKKEDYYKFNNEELKKICEIGGYEFKDKELKREYLLDILLNRKISKLHFKVYKM